MDVRFEVQDLFEKLRPNAKIHENLVDAAEALNEIVAKQVKPIGTRRVCAANAGGHVEPGEDISDGTSEKSDDEQDDRHEPVDEEPEEEDEKFEDTEATPFFIQSNVQTEQVESLEEDEDEEVFQRNIEPEVDEEFNREFAKMMSESLESRKVTAKSAFDVEPPAVRGKPATSTTPDANRIQFAVLSRRNKQVALRPRVD
jgi:regulator of nonsense transcripts 2